MKSTNYWYSLAPSLFVLLVKLPQTLLCGKEVAWPRSTVREVARTLHCRSEQNADNGDVVYGLPLSSLSHVCFLGPSLCNISGRHIWTTWVSHVLFPMAFRFGADNLHNAEGELRRLYRLYSALLHLACRNDRTAFKLSWVERGEGRDATQRPFCPWQSKEWHSLFDWVRFTSC